MSEDHLRLRADAVEWREVEGEVVALDLKRQRYLAANQAGAALWLALAAGATRQELIVGLVERFEVDAQRAAADVDDFLAQLDEEHLLEREQRPD